MTKTANHTKQTQYHYDKLPTSRQGTSQLYKFVYAFFYGFVQNNTYTYDAKLSNYTNIFLLRPYSYDTLRQSSAQAFSKVDYDYDYYCGNMTISNHNAAIDKSLLYQVVASGKETGFDYTSTSSVHSFGARYYVSDLSIWLSVDPLAILSPGVSSYAYVNNNPVMLIDEWGMTPGPIDRIKSWWRRKRRGIRTVRVPHETREVVFTDRNIIVNEQVNNYIVNDGSATDETVTLRRNSRVHQKYLANAKKVKFTFSGTDTEGITITQKKESRNERNIFNGRENITETDYYKLRGNRRRFFSINFEMVFAFNKKEHEVIWVYKSYKVGAKIKASKSYFDNLKKRGIIE
ncbi:MAG: hypothetical protein KAG64_07805 [Bacteroidales bacterium]|nr:hypothetical protein [Bacteroidales bacterium]